MSYNVGIIYRYNSGLIVVITIGTGLVVSYRFTPKLTKFRDHGVSAVPCCFCLPFRNEAQVHVHLPAQLKLQYAAKMWIRNTISTCLKASALIVKFEMTKYFKLSFIFVVFQFIYFLVVKIFDQLFGSSFVMNIDVYPFQ